MARVSFKSKDNIKPKNVGLEWSLLRHCSKYLLPYKKDLIVGLIPVPISVVCSIAFPWMIIQIIDRHLVTREIEGLPFWIALLVFIMVCNYIACNSRFTQRHV
jgi:ATP-binding cassette subfamily B multidrug efflux pump